MNPEKETKDHSGQIRNRDKNDHKWESHSERMDEGPVQYVRKTVTDDHVNETDLQRHNSGKRLDGEK